MSQALHIFRKDLRRGWPLLLLWGCLAAFTAWMACQDPLEAEDLSRVQYGVELLALMLSTMAGSAMIVQHDSLIGECEFWMTRPISPWSLMTAKALFAAVFFVAGPVVVQLGVLIRYGLPPDRWSAHLLQIALPWAGLVVVACLLGSWTKGLPRFLALLLGLMFAPHVLIGIVERLRGHEIAGMTIDGPSLATVAPVATALLVLQYWTRKRILGWAIGVLVGLLLVFPPFQFDFPFFSSRAPETDLGEMRIEVNPGPGRQTSWRLGRRTPAHTPWTSGSSFRTSRYRMDRNC